MKLSSLKQGNRAKVTEIELKSNVKRELEQIGLTEGVSVTVVRYAGFNGPIEIMVRGFYLALRLADADKITVKRLDTE